MKGILKRWIARNVPISLLEFLTVLKISALNHNRKGGLKLYRPSHIDRLLILGNGPSLNKSIKKNMEKLKHYDLMVVNQFAVSDYYEILRPQYYVLSDPVYYFYNREFKEDTDLLISAIKKKTKWKLVIFISERAKKSRLVKELSGVKGIRFVYYNGNYVHYYWFKNKKLFQLLNKDMIEPPAQTVVNTGIAIGIYYKYKNIFIAGADTSWHEEFMIDQKTNDMYLEVKHFYGNKRVLYKTHTKITSNIGEELLSASKVFFFYQFLQEYAEYNQLNIFNASEFSWIDVFERKCLEDA